MEQRIRGGLRSRIFLAHLLVIAVGMVTLFVATLSIAPTLFDRLMAAMMGPNAPSMGGMMAGIAETTAQAFRSAMLQALLLSAGAATLAAVVVSLFVSARIVTPIQRLLAASARIASGHYAERVPATQTDELGALAAQFNTMAAELEAAERHRVASSATLRMSYARRSPRSRATPRGCSTAWSRRARRPGRSCTTRPHGCGGSCRSSRSCRVPRPASCHCSCAPAAPPNWSIRQYAESRHSLGRRVSR